MNETYLFCAIISALVSIVISVIYHFIYGSLHGRDIEDLEQRVGMNYHNIKDLNSMVFPKNSKNEYYDPEHGHIKINDNFFWKEEGDSTKDAREHIFTTCSKCTMPTRCEPAAMCIVPDSVDAQYPSLSRTCLNCTTQDLCKNKEYCLISKYINDPFIS